MINLFNLMPLGSMDGGRICGALHPGFLLVGIGMGGYAIMAGVIKNPLIYFILFAGMYQCYQRFFGDEGLPPSYYNLTLAQKGVVGGAYFGLMILLLVAMQMMARRQKSVQQLQHERDNGITDHNAVLKDKWGNENPNQFSDSEWDKEWAGDDGFGGSSGSTEI